MRLFQLSFILLFILVPILVLSENILLTCDNQQSQINNLTIFNTELKQDNKNLTLEKNYYKDLYEDFNTNLTNREVILLYQNIYNLNQNITALKEEINNRVTIFSLEIGISIISLSALSVTLIELTLSWLRRRNEKK